MNDRVEDALDRSRQTVVVVSYKFPTPRRLWYSLTSWTVVTVMRVARVQSRSCLQPFKAVVGPLESPTRKPH